MLPVPWASGLTSDPVVARLRDDACAVLAAGRVWSLESVVTALQVTWGRQMPPAEWVGAAMAEDERLWRLPDGRWLHLLGTVSGRWFTTRPRPALDAVGMLHIGVDLVAALLPFATWDRIPLSSRRGRGMLERVPAGPPRLVCPPALVPPAQELLGIVPGPEGLWLHGEDLQVDPMADLRHRRALIRQLREHTPVAGPAEPGGRVPRPWTVADLELLILASDDSMRRHVVAPLSASGILPELQRDVG